MAADEFLNLCQNPLPVHHHILRAVAGAYHLQRRVGDEVIFAVFVEREAKVMTRQLVSRGMRM